MKRAKIKRINPVAKHAAKFNKCSVMVDRKKKLKTRKQKHKHKET